MSSYSSIDTSVADGHPFYLYQFTQGEQIWRFTSRQQDFDDGTNVWTASPVEHGEITLSSTIERGSFSLTYPLSDTFARRFLEATSYSYVHLTIFRGHEALPTDRIVHWKGRVVGAEVSGVTIVLTCESIFSTLRRQGCRAKYQSLCRHILYHGGCRLDAADYFVSGTVSAVSGVEVTVAEAAQAADGWYSAGVLKCGDAYGFISSHSGEVLTLGARMPDLETALAAAEDGTVAVEIAPGCDLREATCESKFGNLLNYGGFTRIPGRNPFGGTSIV